MADDIRNLIEKIQQEGIKVAEGKAQEIESQARRQAEEIIKKAKAEAQKQISDAQEQIARAEETSKVLLKQAGRDLILGLKKEINAILDKVIVSAVQQALSPQELTKILTALIKNYSDKGEIVVSLSKEDLEKLEKGLLTVLTQEAKKGITLRPSEDIQAGFIISYDAGKSHYDFTDAALAEYIGSLLKPKLKEILQ